jgi:hypothetical protein
MLDGLRASAGVGVSAPSSSLNRELVAVSSWSVLSVAIVEMVMAKEGRGSSATGLSAGLANRCAIGSGIGGRGITGTGGTGGSSVWVDEVGSFCFRRNREPIRDFFFPDSLK